MKKIVLLMFLVCAALTANAQVYVGGNVAFWDNDDADRTLFLIAPEVGYNFNEKWAVGAELGYTNLKIAGEKTNAFVFNPYARYSYFQSGIVRLFLDGTVGISSSKFDGGSSNTGFSIGINPGVAIKLNDKFNIISKFGFLGYRDEYIDSNLEGSHGFGLLLSGSDLTVGFQINF